METAERDNDTDARDAEIERLKEALRSKNDMYLRAIADFDNYRKRVRRDLDSSVRSGKREIVVALLQVLDGFDRALEHSVGNPSAVVEGMRAIYRQLLNQLEAQGIQCFKSRGETFDPKLHEAVASVKSDREPGTIIDELARGYRWGDELLRPARVTVAR